MTASNSRLLTRLALIPCLAVAMVLVAFSSPAQAQKVRPDFFGMHDSQIAYQGSVPGVKTGAVRLWDTGTSWREIETSRGRFNWSQLDRARDAALSNGLRPLLVLGQTPRFHAKNRMAPGDYGDGASSMPRIAAWKRYVTAVAKRYGNQMDYQTWNEPNVINFWTGTESQMAKLTATASAQINRVVGRRKATVVAPSFPLRLTGQQEWFRKYWAQKVNGKGMASYVDVVSVNPYPFDDQGPEASNKLLGFAKRALPTAARNKPMWITEINYGLRGGRSAKTISHAKQAAFVARTLVLNAASSIRRVYWYSWDINPVIANTHLVKHNGTTLTPAGRAWQVVRGWLAGTNTKNCTQARRGKLKGLYTCTARESRTEVRRFYWKPTGAAVKITSPRSTRGWTTLSGNRTARKGRFPIKVGQSPIMVTSRR